MTHNYISMKTFTQKQKKEILERMVKKTNDYYEESVNQQEQKENEKMIKGI